MRILFFFCAKMRKKSSQLHFASCVHFGEFQIFFAKMRKYSLNCTLYYHVCILEKQFSQLHSIAFTRILSSFLQKCKTVLSIAFCIMCAFWRIPDFIRILFYFSSFAKIRNCSLYNVCILDNSQFYKHSFLFLAKMQNNFSIALCTICAFWRIPNFIRILFFFCKNAKQFSQLQFV